MINLKITPEQAATLEYFLADRLDDYAQYVMACPDDAEHAASLQETFDNTSEVHALLQAIMAESLQHDKAATTTDDRD